MRAEGGCCMVGVLVLMESTSLYSGSKLGVPVQTGFVHPSSVLARGDFSCENWAAFTFDLYCMQATPSYRVLYCCLACRDLSSAGRSSCLT